MKKIMRIARTGMPPFRRERHISYVHKYAPIIMYGLGLFIVVLTITTMFTYDVACRVSKPHKSAKFHGLVLFGLQVTLFE